MPVNVTATWSGTSTSTFTQGPTCLNRQPVTVPTTVQISQSGTAISGTLNHCSFHGTVNGTAIRWAQDAEQSDPICLTAYLVLCAAQGDIAYLDIGRPSTSVAGTVTGNQMLVSGAATSEIFDPSNGQPSGTVQASVVLKLERQ
jgi:hypothetical protein